MDSTNVALGEPSCNLRTIDDTFMNLIDDAFPKKEGIPPQIVEVLNFYPRSLQRPSANRP